MQMNDMNVFYKFNKIKMLSKIFDYIFKLFSIY